MNYSEMSDYEINVLVSEKEGYYYKSPSCTYVSKSGDTAVYLHKDNGWSKWVDYCNDWRDIGPIMMANGIDIEWPEPSLGGVGQCQKYVQGGADIVVEFKTKEEALRAAAICYLEM